MNCPLAFAAILHAMQLSRSWGNRAQRRGWIKLTRVGRKNFVLPKDLAAFNERAARGEFDLGSGGACSKKKGASHV